jgi:hypothetical protein
MTDPAGTFAVMNVTKGWVPALMLAAPRVSEALGPGVVAACAVAGTASNTAPAAATKATRRSRGDRE